MGSLAARKGETTSRVGTTFHAGFEQCAEPGLLNFQPLVAFFFRVCLVELAGRQVDSTAHIQLKFRRSSRKGHSQVNISASEPRVEYRRNFISINFN